MAPPPREKNKSRRTSATSSSSDAESLLASSALLEIRSDLRGGASMNTASSTSAAARGGQSTSQAVAVPVPSPPSRQKRPPRHTPAPIPPPPPVTIHNPILPNLPAARAPSAPPLVAPNLPYNGVLTAEQIAALRVAAAASAASLAAATAPLNQINLLQQASSSLTGQVSAIPIMQRQAAAAAAAQAMASVSAQVPTPQPTGETGLTLPPTATSEGNSSSSSSSIRKEQVEAALKSKPQRGRKREDLSELERLELTRTRNREHAKSTRIRKKARHQELLDIEKRYGDMEAQLRLDAQRRAAIAAFLRVREHMLHTFQASDSSQSSGENTAPASNKTALTTTATSSSSTLQLEDLVDDVTQFHFDEGWFKQHDDDPANTLSSTERMKRLDEYWHSSVVQKFGNMLVPMLRLGVKGGDQAGIALDRADGGVVEVELALALSTRILLVSGIMRFRFRPNSEKLQGVTHVHSMDLLASSERLDAQVSYPSTVSLDLPPSSSSSGGGGGAAGDNNNSKPEAKHNDDSAGPGMNI